MMKRLISVTLSMLMILSLSACAGKMTARDAVDDAMTSLIACDQKAIEGYFGENPLFDEKIRISDEIDVAQPIMDAMCKQLTYQITSVEEDGNTATATILVASKDMIGVLSQFINFIFTREADTLAMDEADRPSKEEQNQEAIEKYISLLDETENRASHSATFTMQKGTFGKWTINVNDELLDAVSGGLITLTNNLDNFGSDWSDEEDIIEEEPIEDEIPDFGSTTQN